MFLLLHIFPYVLWLHSFLKMKLTAFVSLPDTSNHKKSGILHICKMPDFFMLNAIRWVLFSNGSDFNGYQDKY